MSTSRIIPTSSSPSGSAGGDLSGTYPNPTVAKINGATLGSTTATSGNLLIGSGTQWVTNAMSGDITITSGGVTAIGANKVTTTTINANAVTLAKLATQADQTFLANNSGGTAVPSAVTATSATAMLSTFVASGASHAKGLVPDPGASSGTTKFLCEDATFKTVPSSAGGAMSSVGAGSLSAGTLSSPTLSLDGLGTNGAYYIIGSVKIGASCDLRINFNADTTTTNYDRFVVFSNGSASGGNSNNLLSSAVNTNVVRFKITVFKDTEGHPQALVEISALSTSSLIGGTAGYVWRTTGTNVTSINIYQSSGSFTSATMAVYSITP